MVLAEFRWMCLYFSEWWPGAELNCRHEDFQSTALPTELPGREVIRRTKFEGYEFRVIQAQELQRLKPERETIRTTNYSAVIV